MIISDSSLAMGSQRTSFTKNQVFERESVSITVNQAAKKDNSSPAKISDEGRKAQANEPDEPDPLVAAMRKLSNDPTLKFIALLVSRLTGQEIKVFDAEKLRPEFTISMTRERLEIKSEFEETSFVASGSVRTADGREINFALGLTMSRAYYEENYSQWSVEASINGTRRKDPLVINFDASSTQLTNQRFSFDIDADGTSDNIAFATRGSGFLVFDRNADGKINDGRELFGALTGDGFKELAAFDEDHNGWIDENDTVFSRLGLWNKGAQGEDVFLSLKDAGIGAISLSRLATPFDLKNGSEMQGQVLTSGVFLKENGSAGSVQQIDLMA